MAEDDENTSSNEKTKDEALRKLKELPESMASKRRRKTKLGTVPHGRLNVWRRLKWTTHKKWVRVHHSWQHDFSNFRIFQRSLQKIEVRCGTAIVNVFLFVRWSLFLNLLIAILSICVVVIPYHMVNYWIIKRVLIPGDDCGLKTLSEIQAKSNNLGWGKDDLKERMACCVKKHRLEAINERDDPHSRRGSLTEILKLVGGKDFVIEESPFFYGHYINTVQLTEGDEDVTYDWFAFAYVLVVLIALGISLILMVRSVGHGIKEMVMASEGDHNPFTSLIFAGWDHYTKDAKSAQFKRKILFHEMQIALNNEKETLEKVLRSKKEQVKLFMLRVAVNLIWLLMTAAAGLAIYFTSFYALDLQQKSYQTSKGESEKEKEKKRTDNALLGFFIGFAPSMLISILNIMFPLILARVGKLEKYSAHTSTACVLYRSLIIRLMSIAFAAASLYYVKYCKLANDGTCTRCDAKSTDNKKQDDRVACWESIFADQLYKLLFADFILKVFLTMIVEPLRLQLKKWFDHKIFQKIGTMKFSVVRHSLDVIYVQVICWIGMYFAPFIPILCVIYSYIVFYIKRFSLFHNCIQVPETSRTMKTTTTFVAAKLMSFMAVCLANVYVIGYMTPSRGCGPFRQFDTPWEGVIEVVKTSNNAHIFYEFVASPAVTLPITLILILFGYYLYSVVQANRGMVETLRHLLILEGHDKQYLFARLNSLRQGTAGAAASHAGTGGVRATLDALNISEIEHKIAAPPSKDLMDKDDKDSIDKKKK